MYYKNYLDMLMDNIEGARREADTAKEENDIETVYNSLFNIAGWLAKEAYVQENTYTILKDQVVDRFGQEVFDELQAKAARQFMQLVNAESRIYTMIEKRYCPDYGYTAGGDTE